MAYLTDIQGNNADLQSILDAVNALPDAEGGAVNLQEKTVTPSAATQTLTPESGFIGFSKVVVEGDSNLVSENIVSGKSIFGVQGSASAGSAEVEMVTVTLDAYRSNTDKSRGTTIYARGYDPRDGSLIDQSCASYSTSNPTTFTVPKNTVLYFDRQGYSMSNTYTAKLSIIGSHSLVDNGTYYNSRSTTAKQVAIRCVYVQGDITVY